VNLFTLFDQLPLATLAPLVAIALLAGAARGFAGFGAGLILMPLASTIVEPVLAAATFLVMDFFVAMPLVPPAMRRCNWPTVLPAAIAALLTVPLGTYALVNSDPVLVRWGISIATIAMLGLLLSGWRYRGAPSRPVSLSVGGLAGFLSGIAQIPGPPVVTYWMSGPLPAAIIRANLIAFFFIESIGGIGAYMYSGLFNSAVLVLILAMAPAYGLAVWAGARLHGRAPERWFRGVAYSLIAIAAATSLPALDVVFRG
jgi:uncharacterized protein